VPFAPIVGGEVKVTDSCASGLTLRAPLGGDSCEFAARRSSMAAPTASIVASMIEADFRNSILGRSQISQYTLSNVQNKDNSRLYHACFMS